MVQRQTAETQNGEDDPSRMTASGLGASWDPEVSEILFGLIHNVDLASPTLENELENLVQEYEDSVYSELIYMLSHLRFSRAEARDYWFKILEHRNHMQERLGTFVDLRVALVSYFLQINRKLENPKVIELKVFEQTCATAYRDELTGLYNYRFFLEHLNQEITRCKRNGHPLSLVMIDVDDFKAYNDKNGHDAGNEALTRLAAVLDGSMRQTDVSVRYGGEEFVLILSETPKIGARRVAERARQLIEAEFSGELTVSAGVATYPIDAVDVNELVRGADRAMYVAKDHGKNQVHMHGSCSRSYRRVEAKLEGSFKLQVEQTHPMTTLNLSEGGILFISDRQAPTGSLIEMQISFNKHGRQIKMIGHVMETRTSTAGKFETAVSFIDVPTRDRNILTQRLSEMHTVESEQTKS